jgi:hypothetical protein
MLLLTLLELIRGRVIHMFGEYLAEFIKQGDNKVFFKTIFQYFIENLKIRDQKD